MSDRIQNALSMLTDGQIRVLAAWNGIKLWGRGTSKLFDWNWSPLNLSWYSKLR